MNEIKQALFLLLVLLQTQDLKAQFYGTLESGVVTTGMNTTRIPAVGGTSLSLANELQGETQLYFRVTMNYKPGKHHTFVLLAAPLKTTYKGALSKDVYFVNSQFNLGESVDALYRFNSYRLSYRYSLVMHPKLEIALGITAKIRDAEISLISNEKEESYKNIGGVPLIHFYVRWEFVDKFSLLLNGDAFAVKQGRAEDVLFATNFLLHERMSVYAGYRFLEGGSDGSAVYTFALFHYAALGVCVSL